VPYHFAMEPLGYSTAFDVEPKPLTLLVKALATLPRGKWHLAGDVIAQVPAKRRKSFGASPESTIQELAKGRAQMLIGRAWLHIAGGRRLRLS
jgi:hypothetical protein